MSKFIFYELLLSTFATIRTLFKDRFKLVFNVKANKTPISFEEKRVKALQF